jgi:hypothetical protein
VPPERAVEEGSIHNLRAVLVAAAAAFGFLPMAIATGASAEVQRPLATVVILGMIASAARTLLVFAGTLRTVRSSSLPPDAAPIEGIRMLHQVRGEVGTRGGRVHEPKWFQAVKSRPHRDPDSARGTRPTRRRRSPNRAKGPCRTDSPAVIIRT